MLYSVFDSSYSLYNGLYLYIILFSLLCTGRMGSIVGGMGGGEVFKLFVEVNVGEIFIVISVEESGDIIGTTGDSDTGDINVFGISTDKGDIS